MNTVHLHFDVVSPWSKIAFYTLRRYEKLWNIKLDFTPINQGYLMEFSQNKPPMTVPNKGIWMMSEDMPRAAKLYDVSLRLHDGFPLPTFRAQGLLRTIKDEDRARFVPAIETLFDNVWGDSDLPLVTLDDLRAMFLPLYGKDESKLDALLAQSNSKESKSRMKAEAQALANEGAFGVPWITVTRSDGEKGVFFGSDRLEQIAAFLHVPYLGARANGQTPKL